MSAPGELKTGDRVRSFEDGALGTVFDADNADAEFYGIRDDNGYEWFGFWGTDFGVHDDEPADGPPSVG